MMNYFTMAYPNRLANYMGPGNANPIYTTIVPDLGTSFATAGYFLWTKSSVGYPWDIKAFDTKYRHRNSSKCCAWALKITYLTSPDPATGSTWGPLPPGLRQPLPPAARRSSAGR